MRLTIMNGACAVGLAFTVFTACSKTHDREAKSTSAPSTAEQRRIDEKRAEERADERRAEERRTEERKADLRADDRRADEKRTDDRLANERHEEVRRADDKHGARLASSVDPTLKATPASALTSLATERCDRETRCKNIGAKEKYRTRAACITEMERDKRDDLNSDVCPAGIRQKELNDCLQAIHEESCGNPLDSLARLNACRAGNFCAK